MAEDSSNVPPPVEDGDYYFENGLMVFTAQYLKKRGFCCGSGCRHCPYPLSVPSEKSKN